MLLDLFKVVSIFSIYRVRIIFTFHIYISLIKEGDQKKLYNDLKKNCVTVHFLFLL